MRVIVSRHRSAVQFIIREIGGRVLNDPRTVFVGGEEVGGADSETIPVLAEARPEDIAGKTVYGNIPMHLAALALEVYAVEFSGPPPRGQEYGIAEMDAAGARLSRYVVFSDTQSRAFDEALHSDGYGFETTPRAIKAVTLGL